MLYIYSFHLNDVPILRFIVLTQSYVMCTLKKCFFHVKHNYVSCLIG